MEKDVDLFLLRSNADLIRGSLSKFNQSVLASFLTNFVRFEDLLDETGRTIEGLFPDSQGLMYSYVYEKRLRKKEKKFYGRYGFEPCEIDKRIVKGYNGLASSINEQGMLFLDHIGDYIFVQGQGDIQGLRKIRTLESFSVN